MRRTLNRVAAAVLSAGGSVAVGAQPASADGEFVGACTLDFDVTYSTPLGVVPGPRHLSFVGFGTCVVNGMTADVGVAGLASTTVLGGAYGCAGGVATGTAVFDVDVPGFPSPLIDVLIVDVAGDVTIVGWALALRYEGVGNFVRPPADTARCSGGLQSTTWTGGIAFQDPDPSPIR